MAVAISSANMAAAPVAFRSTDNLWSRSVEFSQKTMQMLQGLRQRDAFVAGVQVTGFLACGTLASWALYGWTAKNVIALAATAGLAKFYGGAKGAMKVFSDYFPQALRLTRSTLKPAPQASETGVWQGNGIAVRWSQFFDPGLADGMASLLRTNGVRSAYDFGCGPNFYTEALFNKGIDTVGIDGNTKKCQILPAIKQDLTVEFSNQKRDCVISLEVGAKIPPKYAERFIQNIADHAGKLIVISWPVPGQKGPHQVNCQTNQWVIEQFEKRGWKHLKEAADQLKASASPVHYWFQDTMMVFKKADN